MKGKFVILEKLSGERYRPDMLVGDRSIIGYCLEPPQVGYQFFLYSSAEDVKIRMNETESYTIPKEDLLTAWTSVVREVDLENNIIKTANSVYKIEVKDE